MTSAPPIITAPMEQERKLRMLVASFLVLNTQINLSALRTEDACWIGNVLDSLALDAALPLLRLPPTVTLLDVGSGGGFPLLPLAIAHGDWTCTGVDSIGKKMKAVGQLSRDLGLHNVRTLAERCEVTGHQTQHREAYHIVCARAVASLATLLEYCAPFAAVGGYVIAWKSMSIEKELRSSEAAEKALGLRFDGRFIYALPGDFGARQLLMFRKIRPLPARFPRMMGEAKRAPLSAGD